MAKIQEPNRDEVSAEPKSHAVVTCEQGCIASGEQCVENQEADDCRNELLKCIDNCQVLLSPSS